MECSIMACSCLVHWAWCLQSLSGSSTVCTNQAISDPPTSSTFTRKRCVCACVFLIQIST
jgi:hypothetical protein